MDEGIVLPNGRPVKDLRGQRFGRLFVAGYAGQSKPTGGQSYWFCMCDCGGVKKVRGTCLLTRVIDNCGCLKKARQALAKVKHGMSGSREYKTWVGMIRRCHDPKSDSFRNYGARGIAVCDRWRMSFEAFYEDVGRKPSGNYSLERINNDRGYEPENVRWATVIEQHQNTRSNVILEFNGEKLCVAEWSRRTGLADASIRSRIKKGWSAEKILTTPAG